MTAPHPRAFSPSENFICGRCHRMDHVESDCEWPAERRKPAHQVEGPAVVPEGSGFVVAMLVAVAFWGFIGLVLWARSRA